MLLGFSSLGGDYRTEKEGGSAETMGEWTVQVRNDHIESGGSYPEGKKGGEKV